MWPWGRDSSILPASGTFVLDVICRQCQLTAVTVWAVCVCDTASTVAVRYSHSTRCHCMVFGDDVVCVVTLRGDISRKRCSVLQRAAL